MSRGEVSGVHELNLDELSKYFHLPIADAAKQIGVCATVLKKICRKNDIPRWPHRKIKSIDKMIKTLESTLGRSPEDDAEIKKELNTLLKHREYVMKNPASLVKYKRKNNSDSTTTSSSAKKQKTNEGDNSFVSKNVQVNHQYDDHVYHINVNSNTHIQNNLMHDYIRHPNPQHLTQFQFGQVYYPQYISQDMVDYSFMPTGGEDSSRYIPPYFFVNHGQHESDLNDYQNDILTLSNPYLTPTNSKIINSTSKPMKSDNHFQQLYPLQPQPQQFHIHPQQFQHIQLQPQQLQSSQKKSKVTMSDQSKSNIKFVENTTTTTVNFNDNQKLLNHNNEVDQNDNGNKLILPIPEWYNEDKDNYLALQEKMGLI